MQNNRNADVLRRIISYCSDISEAIQRFGKDYTVFTKDSVYKNATALCVLQIGELTTHLSDDFKNTYTGIPWTQIKALRNIVAHSYGKIDDESLWETITSDIYYVPSGKAKELFGIVDITGNLKSKTWQRG